MPWVRFDDQFPINRKVAGLSDAAYRLHSEALFWCARNLTDGYVAEDDLPYIRPWLGNPAQYAAECVQRRVWHMTSELCPSQYCPAPVTEGPGWVIHDYWEYQPSRAKVLQRRADVAARQARWRQRAAGRRVGDASRNASRNASTSPQVQPPDVGNVESNASRNASVDVYPTRRVGSLQDPTPTGRGDRTKKTTRQDIHKPPWCGKCDADTRQTGDPPRRCPDCHPLRPVDDPWATP